MVAGADGAELEAAEMPLTAAKAPPVVSPARATTPALRVSERLVLVGAGRMDEVSLGSMSGTLGRLPAVWCGTN